MRMLVTYLTDVWKLSLVHATSIVNIWEGAAKALPLAVALLSNTFWFIGRARVLMLCNLAYAIGLGLLTLSTPPLLGHSTGTCTHYQAECIGTTQKILFFTALPLVAVGMASISFVFAAISEVVGEEELTQEEVYSSHSLLLLPNYIGGVTFSYIKPWSVRFGIPAICCVVITMCYMSFCCLDIALLTSGDWVEESPLTKVIRVFVASASKVYQKLDGVELYEKTNTPSLPRTRWLRCLDKAAIILPNKSRDEQENDKWTLCTVTEVEETKAAIRMAPLCLSFIIGGVVVSVGNSFFLEQANHLNPQLGKLKVSFTLLLVLYDMVKAPLSKIRLPLRLGTSVAILFSVLCCITAAKVENRRLHAIIAHNLLDRPDDRVPMTLFWMVPQYVLLAVVDSFLEQNVKLFFQRMIPTSSLLYLSLFTRAVTGIGIMGGVLSVFVVGKLSERGGKLNWFQSTLNRSRLDKYYWTVAALSAASLVFYILLSCYKEPQTEAEAEAEASSRP
ncbi:UNVERIFIED_CONTAM: protein NRT1/ PTR FAMILY 5.5 [Sesamum radiatum]|uniref:Protein NRT1/ PTR FAMILY 5.5 n=1 Tax=Sesamum radiatum TaxID=300843 RepID=A0AAW2JVU4_SESRA